MASTLVRGRGVRKGAEDRGSGWWKKSQQLEDYLEADNCLTDDYDLR